MPEKKGRLIFKDMGLGEFEVRNKKNTLLGTIYHYPIWDTYVLESFGDIIFSSDCLRQIADFLDNPEV